MASEESPDYKSIQVLFPGNLRRESVSGVFLPPGSRYWEISEYSDIKKEHKNLMGIWYYETDPMHVVTKLGKYVVDVTADTNDILYRLFLDDSDSVTEALAELAGHAEKILSSQIPKIDEIYQNYKKVTDGIEIQKPYEKESPLYLFPMMIDRKESPVDHLAYLKSPKQHETKKGLIMDSVTLDKILELFPHIIKSEKSYIFCKKIPEGIDKLMTAYEVWPDVTEQLRLSGRAIPAEIVRHSKEKITS
jgi:hypothetical protein